MDYEVTLLSAAARDLRRLPVDVRSRLLRALSSLKEPRQSGTKKLQGSDDRWRLRVGDYRIIYRIVDAEQKVIVVRIAHRRDVYRPT
jgi:mRNA interferase RelE/StbE